MYSSPSLEECTILFAHQGKIIYFAIEVFFRCLFMSFKYLMLFKPYFVVMLRLIVFPVFGRHCLSYQKFRSLAIRFSSYWENNNLDFCIGKNSHYDYGNVTGLKLKLTQFMQWISVYIKHSFIIGITILRYLSTLGTLSQNTAGKQDGLL